MNTSQSRQITKSPPDPTALVIEQLRQEAQRKYPRRLKVLARRLRWSSAKLSKVLAGEQPAKLGEVVTLCAALAVPLSHLLRVAGA